MMKAFKYRLYPNKTTEKKLFWTLARCQELYNTALSERRDAYTYAGKSINWYEQKRDLPEIKQIHELSLKYANAMGRELSLMSAGQVDEAREIDEAEVDPTLDQLHAELVTANQVQDRKSTTAWFAISLRHVSQFERHRNSC